MGTLFIRGYRIEYDDRKDRCTECRRYEAMTNEQLAELERRVALDYVKKLNEGWGSAVQQLPSSWIRRRNRDR